MTCGALRKWVRATTIAAAVVAFGLMVDMPAASAAVPPATVLTIYAAGTLAVPFQQVDAAFEKLHPGVVVQPQFGGSNMMARRIAALHQRADVYASADYAVIPKILGKAGLSTWFVGFAGNAVTLAYTPRSRGAAHIDAQNWYRVVAAPGVVIGRSDPDTDPSGYQFLQMLSLASPYYHQPDLEQRVLKNAPRSAMRDTETALISALQLGQIDYLAIYSSSAIAHHLGYVKLPADINLEDPSKYQLYRRGSAETAGGELHGRPIIYAATVPATAEHKALAAEYIRFLIGNRGRAILAQSGLVPLDHALTEGGAAVPATLRGESRAWPEGLAVGP